MAIDVKLPDLGDGIESGDVLEIYVSEGESVKKGQSLLELETDKATVGVPCPQAGTISKIMVASGQSVAVGQVIVQLEAAESSAASKSPTSAKPDQADQAESDKPKEEPAQAKQAPADTAQQPAEEKPSRSSTAPKESAASSPAASTKQSSDAKGGSPSGAAPATTATTEPPAASAPSGGSDVLVAASPAVRRFAREVGVDLTTVQGSGEGGRISREDVLKAVRESSARAHTATAAPPAEGQRSASPSSASGAASARELPGTPGTDEYGPVRIERLSRIRKTIATQMHKSWTVAPQLTNFDDADVTELEAFRISSKDDYAARGIKLTSMPFLVKAVATALRSHPTLNASIDLEGEQIIYHDYVNLGIAVDTERGLVVPNIRNAHQLSIPEIAKALADTAGRVRSGDFTVGDLRGGTFTISNLGAIGGTYSTPIVNVPEVAILLVGRTRKLPVVMNDDSIRVRQMMPLSLSYDHRLVDGAAASRFLNEVIALLETPSRLLLAIS